MNNQFKFLLITSLVILSSCADDILIENIPSDIPQNSVLNVMGNTTLYGCDFSQNIGGGNGYSEIFNDFDATKIINSNNVSQFKSIVENSNSNDIIYIDEDLIVNIDERISLPANITIASNRGSGNSIGAEIRLIGADSVIFEATNSNIRFSGLRLNGNNIYRSRGIEGNSVEVDNCEAFNFGKEAIALWGAQNHIHNNYLHDNQEAGYGYGIGVYTNAFAKIEFNKFKNNRHHISGNGKQLCGFEASNNHILYSPNETNTGFDMHHVGHPQEANNEEGKAAGGLTLIHHNTFEKVFYPQISFRGIPKNGCFVYNNHFKNSETDPVFNDRPLIHQRNYFGNLFNFNNKYGFNQTRWKIAWSGQNNWEDIDLGNFPFEDIYAISDFDGDYKFDVVKRTEVDLLGVINENLLITNTENNLDVSQYSETVSDWRFLNDSNVSSDNLLLGDFNGDGKADILRIDGGIWSVIWSGKGNWQQINSSNVPISQIRLGDFNGDNKTDVLRIAGGVWRVVWSGTGNWQTLNSSSVPISQIRLGDFDGNGKTDILRINGGVWNVVWDGTGNWNPINSSNVPISQIRLGDFNGDQKTDILRVAGGLWRVVWSGTGSWQTINSSNDPIESLILGDFNGDGSTDVLSSYFTNIL